MKTFKQFQEETQQLDEIAPALALAGKIIGGGLAAYSGYSALKNLSKGKYKQAGMDALGVIPGGRVFKGIRALGGAKNLARAGSFVQSANRFNVTGLTPNAYARGTDKLFDVATGGAFSKQNKKAEQTKIKQDPNAIKKEPNKYAGKTFKTVSTSMKLGGDKKKDIVKGGSKVGDAVNKVAKDMVKK